MSFISKGTNMFKIRTKSNKQVDRNLKTVEDCGREFRLWSLNAYDRHRAIVDHMNGVQYVGEGNDGNDDSVKNPAGAGGDWNPDESKALVERLTADNEELIQLLRKCEAEKEDLSQINSELKEFQLQLSHQRKSIDMERENRHQLVSDYENKIKMLNKELGSNANLIRMLQEELQELPVIERELEEIKNRMSADNQQRGQLQNEARETARAESMRDVLQTEQAKIQQQYDKQLENWKGQLEEERKELDQQRNKLIEEKNALLRSSEEVDKMRKSGEEMLGKLQKEYERLKKDNILLKEKESFLQRERDCLNEALQKTKREIEQMKLLINDLDQKAKTEKEKRCKVAMELKVVSTEREKLRNHLSDALEDLRNAREKNSKLAEEHRELQEKFEREKTDLQEKFDALKIERDGLNELNSQQASLAAEREEHLKKLKTTLKKLESSNANLRETNEWLKKKENEGKLQKAAEELAASDNKECLKELVSCPCKVLESKLASPIAGNVKDVLAKALVSGLQSLSFSEIAQLHQDLQSALGQLLESSQIVIESDPPVTLSYLHKLNAARKEEIREKIDEAEKQLKHQHKIFKKDVLNLEHGVMSTKNRVERLKERSQKLSQLKSATRR